MAGARSRGPRGRIARRVRFVRRDVAGLARPPAVAGEERIARGSVVRVEDRSGGRRGDSLRHPFALSLSKGDSPVQFVVRQAHHDRFSP
jgi:hypothetical protein